MATQTRRNDRPSTVSSGPAPRPTKRDQIISLFLSGLGDVGDIAMITGSRPSYVGTVLQDAGLHHGYFDLYTSTARPMNVYSKFFAGQLGFRDVEAACKSIDLIDRLHRQFELAGDRAGQHHALLMALTMFDRARWTDKGREAEVFRRWLLDRLGEATSAATNQPAPSASVIPRRPTGVTRESKETRPATS
jgi:hypothetical protein